MLWGEVDARALLRGPVGRRSIELELELTQTHMTQKPVLWVEVGGVSIRATDKHSEKVIKFPDSGTSLNAKVGRRFIGYRSAAA